MNSLWLSEAHLAGKYVKSNHSEVRGWIVGGYINSYAAIVFLVKTPKGTLEEIAIDNLVFTTKSEVE